MLPAPASAVANDSTALMTSVRHDRRAVVALALLGNEVHREKGPHKKLAFWDDVSKRAVIQQPQYVVNKIHSFKFTDFLEFLLTALFSLSYPSIRSNDSLIFLAINW